MNDPTKEQAKLAADYLRRVHDLSLRKLAGRMGCSASKAQNMEAPDVRRFVVKLAGQYGWKK